MTFVSDTSPITNLAAIAQLDLLHQLYGVILIPEAVYAELTRFKVPGCVEAQTLDWIQTVPVQNVALVQGQSPSTKIAVQNTGQRYCQT